MFIPKAKASGARDKCLGLLAKKDQYGQGLDGLSHGVKALQTLELIPIAALSKTVFVTARKGNSLKGNIRSRFPLQLAVPLTPAQQGCSSSQPIKRHLPTWLQPSQCKDHNSAHFLVC